MSTGTMLLLYPNIVPSVVGFVDEDTLVCAVIRCDMIG
jgi:hypothetical protein